MAEFQLICLVVHTVFYRQNKYITHINTECPSVQAHSLLFSHGRQWFRLPCFCNIFKSKYIWMTLTRLTKHQKATRGHVCCLRSEMNEWPLQSFTCFWNHLNHYKKVDSEFWGKPVQYLKCTRFLWGGGEREGQNQATRHVGQ